MLQHPTCGILNSSSVLPCKCSTGLCGGLMTTAVKLNFVNTEVDIEVFEKSDK